VRGIDSWGSDDDGWRERSRPPPPPVHLCARGVIPRTTARGYGTATIQAHRPITRRRGHRMTGGRRLISESFEETKKTVRQLSARSATGRKYYCVGLTQSVPSCLGPTSVRRCRYMICWFVLCFCLYHGPQSKCVPWLVDCQQRESAGAWK
jgi:hypothetical protein